MNRKQILKRAGIILLIIVASLLVGALLLGVINGLVADGEWSFGWTDYRYDDTAYQSGEGTVPAPSVTTLDVDWITGTVEILPCEDAYLSVSEAQKGELAEKLKLRWSISEDGKTVFVKYRASSWFFGDGNDKKLTLRVPQKLFGQLESLKINTKNASVYIGEVEIPSVAVQTKGGNLVVEGCIAQDVTVATEGGSCSFEGNATEGFTFASRGGSLEWKGRELPGSLAISTQSGNVSLSLSKDASFSLNWETEGGGLVSDFALTQADDGSYITGDGKATLTISTKKGDLSITCQN